MKKFLIVSISLVTFLAFFSSALAIDRSPKKSEAKEKKKVEELKEGQKKDVKQGKAKGTTTERRSWEVKRTSPEELSRRKATEKQKTQEKYDYFMDKNNNGIDDRLEKRQKRSVSPPAIRPAPKEKQTAKPTPSAKKTEVKKKVKEAPKKVQEPAKKTEVRKPEKVEEKKKR
jgi:hypothetical protein